eukprot:5038698-Amphidinium_carterae.1
MEARDMITRLSQSQSILRGAEVTPWLSQVASLMTHWLTEVVTMKGEGDDDTVETQTKLTGAEALKAKYGKFIAHGCKSVDELTVFSTWRHLLNATELQAVAAKRDALLHAKPTPAAPAAKKQAAKQPATKSKASKPDVTQAALAIMRMGKPSRA